MGVPLEVSRTDERTIQVPIPLGAADSHKFAGFVAESVSKGYYLSGGYAIEGGSQRDPYTVGLKLTFSKDGP